MSHDQLKSFRFRIVIFHVTLCSNLFSGMTKVKVGKEDLSSVEFVEKRRAALERYFKRKKKKKDSSASSHIKH